MNTGYKTGIAHAERILFSNFISIPLSVASFAIAAYAVTNERPATWYNLCGLVYLGVNLSGWLDSLSRKHTGEEPTRPRASLLSNFFNHNP